MSITYKTGDLLSVTDGTIIHGCNAQGGYGGRFGVARVIREQHPWAWEAYDRHWKAHDLRLGDVISATSPDGRLRILNAVTQEFYGREKRRYVSYEAVEAIFRMLGADTTLGQLNMPLIGAGYAGGDWLTIEGIINSAAPRTDIRVWTLDGHVPTARPVLTATPPGPRARYADVARMHGGPVPVPARHGFGSKAMGRKPNV